MDIALGKKARPVTGDPMALDEATRVARSEWPVALVAMPFQDAVRPSIQIALLKSIASSHGFPAETLHLNLELAAMLGGSLYSGLFAHDRARGAGDWLFSLAAFGEDAPDHDGAFLTACRDRIRLDDSEVEQLLGFRTGGVDAYLARLLNTIDWPSYKVVGFTSTFAQTVPSLALARALKQQYKELVVVFGGANMEGEMGVELINPCRLSTTSSPGRET